MYIDRGQSILSLSHIYIHTNKLYLYTLCIILYNPLYFTLLSYLHPVTLSVCNVSLSDSLFLSSMLVHKNLFRDTELTCFVYFFFRASPYFIHLFSFFFLFLLKFFFFLRLEIFSFFFHSIIYKVK